jgi:hypothetical protein
MDTLFCHKSPPFENISPGQRPGARRTGSGGQKEDLRMLKTAAFWRMVFLYYTAPAVVNSGKNHTAAGVPLFWTTTKHKTGRAYLHPATPVFRRRITYKLIRRSPYAHRQIAHVS